MSSSDTSYPDRQRLNWFWRIIRPIAELIVVVIQRWRLDVRGLDRIPTEGPAILAWNHHSYFDFVIVAYQIVRKLKRPIRVLAKRELWSAWKVRWIVKGALAIPVDRGHGTTALEQAVDAVRAGDIVVIAPEGTISPSFELLPFRPGAVRIAQLTGVPIIPAIGWGTHRFMTKGHGPHLARRASVVIEYGEPIHIGPDDELDEANDRLRSAMEAMLHRIQETYADGTPAGSWWVPARLGGGAPWHEAVIAEMDERRLGRRPRSARVLEGDLEDEPPARAS